MSKKIDKRNLILNKAEELFREKGYQTVKVEDITKALGIAKGSFYTYFQSKEDVILEIIELFKEKLKILLSEIDVSKDTKYILKEYIYKKAEILVKSFHKMNPRNLIDLIGNPIFYEKKKEIIKINIDFIVNNIVKKYENSKLDNLFIAEYILSSIEEYFFRQMLENKIGDRETYLERKKEEIEQIVEFIHNGLIK